MHTASHTTHLYPCHMLLAQDGIQGHPQGPGAGRGVGGRGGRDGRRRDEGCMGWLASVSISLR